VWANPVALWQDAANKSPQKWRPHFQLASALYESSSCAGAARAFDAASRLAPPAYDLLLDWGLALDCAGDWQGALVKLQQSSTLQPSAHVQSQIGVVYAEHSKWEEALAALRQAEQIDPNFDMTYAYRGQIFESTGHKADAAAQYKRALALNPLNSVARDGLTRVSQ
jgi:tetratricopeptide (TPR) repeat protein